MESPTDDIGALLPPYHAGRFALGSLQAATVPLLRPATTVVPHGDRPMLEMVAIAPVVGGGSGTAVAPAAMLYVCHTATDLRGGETRLSDGRVTRVFINSRPPQRIAQESIPELGLS